MLIILQVRIDDVGDCFCDTVYMRTAGDV